MSGNAELIARAKKSLDDNYIIADEAASISGIDTIDEYAALIRDLIEALEQLEPKLQLQRTTYTHPGRIPEFAVTVGERARDLQSGNEGLVLDIRRDTRFAPWKVAMKLDRDGSTWQFYAHQIVAPKGQ